MGIDDILAGHRDAIREAARSFGVKSVYIFGSVARGEARPDSDVDVLVEYDHPVGLFEFVRLKRRLEDILGRPVDMTTEDALKPALRESIRKEAVRAA